MRGEAPRSRSLLWFGAIVLVSALILFLHARRFFPFMSDDAFISLRYARRFLDGAGLTWNDGEFVEGYSNLLWILACAGLGRLGMDLVLAARLLGALGMVAALAALVGIGRGASLGGPLPAIFAGLGFALCGSIAVWAGAGMEQPMIAGLYAWALVACLPLLEDEIPAGSPWRLTLRPGLLMGLMCLTRPDSPIFVAGATLALLIVTRFSARGFRLAFTLALVPALFTLAQLAFRLAYYGEWIPNPARVKIGFSLARVRLGLDYLASGLPILLPFFAVILFGLLVLAPAARLRRRLVFCLLPFALWSLYVACVGGDIFLAHRQFVPLIILAILAASSLLPAAERFKGPRRTGAWLLALAALAALIPFGSYDADSEIWRLSIAEWNGRRVGLTLKEAFGTERPLLAVDAAGFTPYYSELPCLDMLGLNDSTLSHRRPEDFGEGRLAHELGDAEYFFERKPDLILFGWAAGLFDAQYPASRAMQKDPRFGRLYQHMKLPLEDPEDPERYGLVWLRREDGRIGITREDDRILVPGYLATMGHGQMATVLPDGKLSATATDSLPAVLKQLALPAGVWSLSLNQGTTPFRLDARLDRRQLSVSVSAAEAVFEIPDRRRSSVDFELSPAPGSASLIIHRLVLRRL